MYTEFDRYTIYHLLFKGGIKRNDITKLLNTKVPIEKRESLDRLSKEGLEIIDKYTKELSNKVKEILDELYK